MLYTLASQALHETGARAYVHRAMTPDQARCLLIKQKSVLFIRNQLYKFQYSRIMAIMYTLQSHSNQQ